MIRKEYGGGMGDATTSLVIQGDQKYQKNGE